MFSQETKAATRRDEENVRLLGEIFVAMLIADEQQH